MVVSVATGFVMHLVDLVAYGIVDGKERAWRQDAATAATVRRWFIQNMLISVETGTFP